MDNYIFVFLPIYYRTSIINDCQIQQLRHKTKEHLLSFKTLAASIITLQRPK